MNFSINKEVLLSQLIVSQKALSIKTPNPALKGVKLDVQPDHIVVTTSNSDIAIQVVLKHDSLNVSETGEALVPGKYFIELVKKLSGLKVEISLGADNMMRVESDHSDATLNLMELEDFPHVEFTTLENPVIIPARTFKSLIRQTAFATSTVENRPILTGVSLNLSGDQLTAIATDSYRLSKKWINIPGASFEEQNIVIPGRSLEELIKILDNSEENIELHIMNNKVLFVIDGILFQSRLLEGRYPETDKLIPQSFANEIVFNKEQLQQAIDRASLFTPRDGNNVYVRLTLREDMLVEITSNSQEIGSVKEEITPVQNVVGTPFKLAFKNRYISEALRVFHSSEVKLSFTGEIKPFIITSEYDKDMIQLVLPVRTD
jgi:DNA polymerase-3 subunit beta